MDPNETKWESCMGLSSSIQELFVSAQEDMPPLSVIHPRSSLRLYRKQINCSNWGFDLMFCESGLRKALNCFSLCALKMTYTETQICNTHCWKTDTLWLTRRVVTCSVARCQRANKAAPSHLSSIFIKGDKSIFQELRLSVQTRSYKVLKQSRTTQNVVK